MINPTALGSHASTTRLLSPKSAPIVELDLSLSVPDDGEIDVRCVAVEVVSAQDESEMYTAVSKLRNTGINMSRHYQCRWESKAALEESGCGPMDSVNRQLDRRSSSCILLHSYLRFLRFYSEIRIGAFVLRQNSLMSKVSTEASRRFEINGKRGSKRWNGDSWIGRIELSLLPNHQRYAANARKQNPKFAGEKVLRQCC